MTGRYPQATPFDVTDLDQRYGGAAPMRAGGPPMPPPPPQVLRPVAAIPPFYYVKPPSGVDFYFNETATVAAGAGSSVIIAPTTALVIQPLYEGLVAAVTIFLDAPTTDTDVRFTLRFNGGPVQGADNLRSFPRTANNLSISFPFNIIVPGGAVIDVLAINQNAFGPWDIGAEVTGWQYPESLRRRVFGEETY